MKRNEWQLTKSIEPRIHHFLTRNQTFNLLATERRYSDFHRFEQHYIHGWLVSQRATRDFSNFFSKTLTSYYAMYNYLYNITMQLTDIILYIFIKQTLTSRYILYCTVRCITL